MTSTFILTMVFLLAGNTGGPGAVATMTSVVVEYKSQAACKSALEANRQALSRGQLVLATCTAKG
jgi:hypothetical protein